MYKWTNCTLNINFIDFKSSFAIFPAITMGARHHISFDGFAYVLNGIGEYTLLSALIGSHEINVQGRAVLAANLGNFCVNKNMYFVK